MRILITGGCGFIGHHVVEHIIKNTDWDIVVLDKLTYASAGFNRLRDIKVFDNKRISLLTTDLTQKIPYGATLEIGDIDYILHLAAETHVDNSIDDPEPFVMANVVGTMHILNFAKLLPNLKKFVYFSTDEIFGPAPDDVRYSEDARYNSTNPYSATKAGGEELAMAYANTYGLPVIVTHTMNVFGERQNVEKFIPSTIKKAMSGEVVIIHANHDLSRSGSRFYIHARNVASAILFILGQSTRREKFNIVGEREVCNLDMAQKIANIVGKELRYKMVDFHTSRPGHDLRYALDGSKMAGRGWVLPVNFDSSLEKTVKWYMENPEWL